MRRLVALAVLAASALACGGGESSLRDEMVGMWVTDHDGAYHTFNDDGTYGAAFTPERALGDDPDFPALEWGDWTLDESVVQLVNAPDTPYCPGVAGTYEIEITGDRMLITLVEDECWYRSQDFGSSMTRYTDQP